MQRNAINPRRLIEEVKKRPKLYDSSLAYNNHEGGLIRKQLWSGVAQILYDKVYEESNEREKEALVREVQVKWKSMRDQFNRVRKLEREDKASGIVRPRKRYLFFEHLKFLERHCKERNTGKRFRTTDDPLNSSSAGGSGNVKTEVVEDESMDNAYASSADNSNPFKDEEDLTFEVHSVVDDTHHEMPAYPQERGYADSRLVQLLDEIVKMQKDEKGDDRMGNKKFLLSLLPFLEKLPDDVNLEVRLQLMSVLQTYSSGESFIKG